MEEENKEIYSSAAVVAKLKKICIGSKFYKYTDDKFEVIRLYDVAEEKNLVRVYDESWKKKSIPIDELMSDYRRLSSDGVLTIMGVKNADNLNDVVVALGRLNHPEDGNLPYTICRQMVSDVFSNTAVMARKAYTENSAINVGISISQDTCPANIEFGVLLMCNELLHSRSIQIYLDDTLDDILKLFRTKKYDNILTNLKSRNLFIDGRVTYGYCGTLRELLLDNNFMYDFRKAFGIMEIPFAVDPESQSLSDQNTEFLAKELKENIIGTYVLKYTKEINLKEIRRKYVLAASAAEGYSNVYIIGYDVASDLV